MIGFAGILVATVAVAALDDRLASERAVRGLVAQGNRAALVAKRNAATGIERSRLELALGELDLAAATDAATRSKLLDAAIAKRSPLLALADDPRLPVWLLDQAEALLLVQPALQGTDLFATAGVLLPEELAAWRNALEQALADLERAGLDKPTGDELLEGERLFRKPLLQAIAAARRLDLEAQAGGRPGQSSPRPGPAAGLELSVNRLPASTRDTLRLALARLALDRQPEEASRLLAALRSASDASVLSLTAAGALEAIGRAERGDDTARGLARRLIASVARSQLVTRLLAADASHRVEQALGAGSTPAAIAPWLDLLASSDDADRIALRGVLIGRLLAHAAIPKPEELGSAPTLLLVARAPELRERDAERLAAELTARAGDANDPAQRLALYELGRTHAKLRRYAEAADALRRFAAAFGDDPLAREALDLALDIDTELAHGLPPSDQRVAALRSTLEVAIARYPDDPRRFSWRLQAAGLAIEAGDGALALRLLASIPATVAESPDARLGEIEALLLQAGSGNAPKAIEDAQGRLDGLRLADRDEARLARRDLLRARWAVLTQGWPLALQSATAALARSGASPVVQQQALALALEVQAASGDPIVVPSAPSLGAAERRAVLERFARTALAAIDATRDRGELDAAEALAKAQLGGVAESLDALTKGGQAVDALLLARILVESRRGAAAIEVARRALASQPGDAVAVATLAEALRQVGGADHLAEAAAILRETQSRVPDRSPAWWELQAELAEVLAATPGNADALRTGIESLRITDPTMGGPRHAARFERIVPPPTER